MSKTKHPNILWFCTDQQRFDTISALGNKHISTPNLDRLCARGTAYTRAYCQAPICTPSRSSFLSGMYPSTIGASRNGNAYFADRFRVSMMATANFITAMPRAMIGRMVMTMRTGSVKRVGIWASFPWISTEFRPSFINPPG